MENIGIILTEKVNVLNRLITAKDDHIKPLESRELRITPVSEDLEHFAIDKTPIHAITLWRVKTVALVVCHLGVILSAQ